MVHTWLIEMIQTLVQYYSMVLIICLHLMFEDIFACGGWALFSKRINRPVLDSADLTVGLL